MVGPILPDPRLSALFGVLPRPNALKALHIDPGLGGPPRPVAFETGPRLCLCPGARIRALLRKRRSILRHALLALGVEPGARRPDNHCGGRGIVPVDEHPDLLAQVPHDAGWIDEIPEPLARGGTAEALGAHLRVAAHRAEPLSFTPQGPISPLPQPAQATMAACFSTRMWSPQRTPSPQEHAVAPEHAITPEDAVAPKDAVAPEYAVAPEHALPQGTALHRRSSCCSADGRRSWRSAIQWRPA